MPSKQCSKERPEPHPPYNYHNIIRTRMMELVLMKVRVFVVINIPLKRPAARTTHDVHVMNAKFKYRNIACEKLSALQLQRATDC